MKQIKTKLILLTAMAMTVLFTGCGSEDTGLTGKALDIYRASAGDAAVLVDSSGRTKDGYSLSRSGDVLDADGKITVKAERLTDYVAAADIVFYDAPDSIEVASDGDGGYFPAGCTVETRVYPSDATGRKLLASSSSGCVRVVGDDGEPADSVSLDINGTAYLKLEALNPGKAEITLKSLDGKVTASLNISAVKMNESDAEQIRKEKESETQAEPEDTKEPELQSLPQDTITDTEGNTVDMPEEGYAPVITEQPEDEISTTDKTANFSVKTEDAETYKWIFINGSGNQILDGDQAKTAFGSSISGYDSDIFIILDPKVSMDGWKIQCIASNSRYSVYSRIATLRVMQGEQKQSEQQEQGQNQSQTAQTGSSQQPVTAQPTQTHVHSYSRTYVKPTASECGRWRYTCSCGDTYDEINSSDPPLQQSGTSHEHSYTEKVVKPTGTSAGYTRHTCSCGYFYDDTFTFLASADAYSCAEAEQAGNEAIAAAGCTLTSTGNTFTAPAEIQASVIEASGGQAYLNTLAKNAVSDTLAQMSASGDKPENHQFRCLVSNSNGTYTVKVIYR